MLDKSYTYNIIINPKLKLKQNLIINKIVDTLNDKRGWRKFGYKFTKIDDVPNSQTSAGKRHSNHLRIIISPNATIQLICKFDGLSCADYSNNTAYLNLENWRHGCPKSKLSLANYRTYVILHEIGHLLGKGHLLAKNYANKKAPVMIQQTLGIYDCKPNCWPLPFED